MAVIMIVDQVQDHPDTEVEIVVMEEVHQVAIEVHQVAVMAAVKVVVVIVMTPMVTAEVVAVMVAANVTHMRHQAVMEDTIIQVMEEVIPDMAHGLLVV